MINNTNEGDWAKTETPSSEWQVQRDLETGKVWRSVWLKQNGQEEDDS